MTQEAAGPALAGDVVLEREFVEGTTGSTTPAPAGGTGEAFIDVAWRQSDAGSETCTGGVETISSIQLVLSGQANGVRVEFDADQTHPLTVCPGAMQVGAIQLDQPAQVINPLRYWNFTIAAPATAIAGRTLDYQVSLQNVRDRAVQFTDGCPYYIQALSGPNGWGSGKEWFVLNCGPIGVVQSGASVVLDMKMTIPVSAPPGAYVLIWEMDVGSVSNGAATANVKVVPN